MKDAAIDILVCTNARLMTIAFNRKLNEAKAISIYLWDTVEINRDVGRITMRRMLRLLRSVVKNIAAIFGRLTA